jgi:hypothetical protein
LQQREGKSILAVWPGPVYRGEHAKPSVDETRSNRYCDTPEPESQVNIADSPVKVAPGVGLSILAGAGDPWITSVTAVLLVKPPPVPVTLITYVPAAHPPVLMLSPVLPLPVTGVGTQIKVAHAGTPESQKVTAALKEFTAITLIP